MPDQQRADCLGCAGHPNLRTPNMDRLAQEGMRFPRAFTVAPLCMPARASFINGLYPHNHAIWRNRGEIPAQDVTFFHLLQRAGYYNAHIGKSHYYAYTAGLHLGRREDYMRARGLDYVHETTGPRATLETDSYLTDDWRAKGLLDLFRRDYAERRAAPFMVRPSPLPTGESMDSYVGRKAVEFIRGYEDERPLCLFVGFPGPHDPWDAPGEYATMYDPAMTPAPIPVPLPGPALPEDVRNKPDLKPLAGLTLDDIRRIRASYYGKISLIDRWVGEILDAFTTRGWADDLFVIFWSDHGEMAGDHGRLYKSTFHESSVGVPLILRRPGVIPAGTVAEALVEIIDVMPTILEAAGAESSPCCLGRSLRPLFADPTRAHRESVLSEVWYEGSRSVMIRDRQYKYAIDEKGRGFMLYDLKCDPREQVNLIGQPDAEGLELKMRDELLRRLLAEQWIMGHDAAKGKEPIQPGGGIIGRAGSGLSQGS